MIYDTSIVITYDKCLGDRSDALYRKELLSVFGIDEFNIDAINKKVGILFNSIFIDDKMKKICEKNANRILCDDLITGFMFCFSYDSFAETHKYICEKMGERSKHSSIDINIKQFN